MKKLTIVTVLKSGPNWKPEYVYNFKKGLDRFLSIPFDFICISDLNLNVNTLPLSDLGSGFWSKMHLFRPDFNLTGPCLYFDLDTIIKGSIDQIVQSCYPYNFLMLQDPWKPKQSGSGMMWWNGDYSFLWTEFISKDEMHWKSIYKEHPRYGDQGFIIDRVEHKQIQEVIKNKTDVCRFSKNESPADSKIIIFAGPNRKPWLNLNHPDVVKYWGEL
jgi:hypothetical protein